MSAHVDLPVKPARVIRNPDRATLAELIARMPNARRTEFDNFNVGTKVVARSKASTFIITDTPDAHSDQTMTRAEGERMAALQDAYIAKQEMLVIDGYIGNDPSFRTAARLIIESANANIAAQQKTLVFHDDRDTADVF